MSTNTLGTFSDHPRKQLFRTAWGKPLLEWLNDFLKKKLIYMGLPGFQALDIIEWIDHLEKIIAFEAKEEDANTFESIFKLLNRFEEQRKIRSFEFYEGFMEKTVMQGVDDKGQIFSQSDFVTVYNLDFCNALTSPCKVSNLKGEVMKFYKLETISRLLELQSMIQGELSNRFVMFLTVNSIFWDDEYRAINVEYLKEYSKRLTKLDNKQKTARQLKAFVFYHLNDAARKTGFNLEFLPPIYYKGRGGMKNEKGKMKEHWLTTFTLLGTNLRDLPKGIKGYKQSEEDFLHSKFIFANDNTFSCFTEKNISERDINLNPVELVKESQTCQILWKKFS